MPVVPIASPSFPRFHPNDQRARDVFQRQNDKLEIIGLRRRIYAVSQNS